MVYIINNILHKACVWLFIHALMSVTKIWYHFWPRWNCVIWKMTKTFIHTMDIYISINSHMAYTQLNLRLHFLHLCDCCTNSNNWGRIFLTKTFIHTMDIYISINSHMAYTQLNLRLHFLNLCDCCTNINNWGRIFLFNLKMTDTLLQFVKTSCAQQEVFLPSSTLMYVKTIGLDILYEFINLTMYCRLSVC